MDIKTDYSDKTATVLITGKLDVTNSHKFKDSLSKIDISCYPEVVLDFTELDMIDSSGIGKILVFLKKVKELNGNLVIKNPNQYIREVFELIQLDKIIDIIPSS